MKTAIHLVAIVLFVVSAVELRADEAKPPELTAEEQKLTAEAKRLTAEAAQLHQLSRQEEAVVKLHDALGHLQTIFPASKYPDGQSDVARTLNNLGFVKQGMASFDEALKYYVQAYEMRQRLFPAVKFPNGDPELANSLTNLGSVLLAMGSHKKALEFHEQALTMKQRLYPASRYPDGHYDLAGSLGNVGSALYVMGSYEQAVGVLERALEMKRKQYTAAHFPDGHPNLASGLNNLGLALQAMGSFEKSLSAFEQVVAMHLKLYSTAKFPDGHPELARSLNNLGTALSNLGFHEKALGYHEQSLAIKQKLYPTSKYPNGHPELATGLNNLGSMLLALGAKEKALTHHEQALVMWRKIYPPDKYPDGTLETATSLTNLGNTSRFLGLGDNALDFHQQALAMTRKLYPAPQWPDGHPDLAANLHNVGGELHAKGSPEKALGFYEEALVMQRRLLERDLRTAPEAQTLDRIAAFPGTRNSYFSAAVRFPETAAKTYDTVWAQKGAVMSLLSRRNLAAFVRRRTSDEVRRDYERLAEARQHLAQLLAHPGKDRVARDKQLAQRTDERDHLERRLAQQLPMLERELALAALGPSDLLTAMPAQTALLDFVRCEHSEKGKDTRWHYLAFVLAAGQPIRRVALGDAEAIDRAIHSWRRAIDLRQDPSPAPSDLGKSVWGPISQHLPPDTKTLFFSTDGDLARIPWAALPVGKDRVLLEDYAIATVPHGPFLLEHLKYPRKFEGKESTFALGGLEYGVKWPALPGTRIELDSMISLAPGERDAASGDAATAERVAKALPKARYAHFATHGEFRADEFAAEKKRELDARKNWVEGQDIRRVAAKNPLGFVGLVLSGGEVLTGLSILDLNLDNLKLVTLSACETGLGEYTGGKGVENLQMVFHIAGAENVVASLWKVSDSATAALMAKFYHELWVNKREPLAALREAQLFIYHHPESIPDLAGERGAPKQKEALAAKSTGASPVARKTADTKLWAAFVLSGVGR